LKIHVRGLPLERDLEVHLGDQAYVGLSRIENDRVNVCGLFRRRRLAAPGAGLIFAYLNAAGLGPLADRLRAAGIDDSSFCAVAAVSFDRRVPARDAVALGDACAMVPPFTGNGMAMAFQSAEVALDPLLAYTRGECDWPATCRAIHVALRRRFRFRLASAHLLHPYLLQPGRQRWLAALNRAHLLPFQSIYSALH
jgi:2-polyprenyl-6-methoxyphenol hydroxylase-like FAD-dependent oxidoreductase